MEKTGFRPEKENGWVRVGENLGGRGKDIQLTDAVGRALIKL